MEKNEETKECEIKKFECPLGYFKFYLDIDAIPTSIKMKRFIKYLGGNILLCWSCEVRHLVTDQNLENNVINGKVRKLSL